MTQELAIDLVRNGLQTALMVAAPMLASGLAVGVVVSVFQSVTQVQELTLTFIPKILAVAIALVIFFPWILRIMLTYTSDIFMHFPEYVR